MGTIDREKHDIDVVERVLGQGEDQRRERDDRVEVIRIDWRSGRVTSTSSASHATRGRATRDEAEE